MHELFTVWTELDSIHNALSCTLAEFVTTSYARPLTLDAFGAECVLTLLAGYDGEAAPLDKGFLALAQLRKQIVAGAVRAPEGLAELIYDVL